MKTIHELKIEAYREGLNCIRNELFLLTPEDIAIRLLQNKENYKIMKAYLQSISINPVTTADMVDHLSDYAAEGMFYN